jgi:hypothetical protein
MFGLGLGFFFTSVIWNDSSGSSSNTSMSTLLYFTAIACTIASIPVIIYFKDRPENAPSKSAKFERVECLKSLMILLKNNDYNYLLAMFSIGLGNFITMILMIHHIIAPFNFSEFEISIIGLIINMASGVSKCFIAFIAGKYISIKKTIIYVLVGTTCSTLLLIFTLDSGKIGYVYLVSFVFGFFCQMYWGPALEYASEIAFPVSESHATGNLLFGGCIMGLITNYLAAIFYGTTNPNFLLIYLFFSYVICIYFIFKISDVLHREAYEKSSNIGNNKIITLVDLMALNANESFSEKK